MRAPKHLPAIAELDEDDSDQDGETGDGVRGVPERTIHSLAETVSSGSARSDKGEEFNLIAVDVDEDEDEDEDEDKEDEEEIEDDEKMNEEVDDDLDEVESDHRSCRAVRTSQKKKAMVESAMRKQAPKPKSKPVLATQGARFNTITYSILKVLWKYTK